MNPALPDTQQDAGNRRRLAVAVLLVLGLACGTPARADTVYLPPEQFIREAFSKTPPPQFLWLDAATQARVQAALGHSYPQARIRYWRGENKSLWVLDEIGKEYPITAGFVVKGGVLEAARVLVYRESRGDEVRYPAFLEQFHGARLVDGKLDKRIDSISGASMSVDAMQRMARTALTLDALAP